MQRVAADCDLLQNRKKQTQNPPTLAVMGVRPPPAPALKHHKISNLQNRQNVCAKYVPKTCQICAKASSFRHHYE